MHSLMSKTEEHGEAYRLVFYTDLTFIFVLIQPLCGFLSRRRQRFCENKRLHTEHVHDAFLWHPHSSFD